MKVTTAQYSSSQATSPATPSSMGEIWAVMPLIILIFIMMMLNNIIKALLQPETLKEVTRGAVTGLLRK